MCFSAPASFIAGGALTGAGGLTISKVKKKRELPFASIPLFFGIQQIAEGIVWISFNMPAINITAAYIFLFFSHVFWPVWVPIAVYLIETHKRRKALLGVFVLFGISVGSYLLWFIATHSVTPTIVQHSICYPTTPPYGWLALFLYISATCGSCLASTHKIVKVLGVLLVISFLIAAYFYVETFFSTWCYFAAILSFVVYLYFRRKKN